MNGVALKLSRRMEAIAKCIAEKLSALQIRSIADIPHVSFELRTAIWNKFIKESDPRTEKMRKKMAGLFKRQFAEVLDNIKKNPPPGKAVLGITKEDLSEEQRHFIELWLYDRDKWRTEFMTETKADIVGALMFGGNDLFATLGLEGEFVTDAETRKYINGHMLKFADEIGKTTEDALKASFLEALKGGESVTDIMVRVQNIMVNATEYRARMIAQTEIIGAINKGSLEGCKQSGVVWGTQWLAALDERTRESHERLTREGAAVALGEKFDIGCEYPGDQNGPAGEVINCRCTTKPLTEKPK